MKGKIVSINIAAEKKTPKKPVTSGNFIKDVGLEDDAYNKTPDRQISIISVELLKEQIQCPRVGKGEEFIVNPGDYKETLTTEGLDLSNVNVGDIFTVGENAKTQISEKGMTCWEFCPWGRLEGECPLPKHFLFAKVIESGQIKTGNKILKVIPSGSL